MAAIDLSKIELLVLDVDGVMTDGQIILTPAGEEIKAFNCRDGAGLRYWKRVGKKLAFITGRSSPAVAVRAADMGVDALRMDAKDKLPAYREVLSALGVREDQTAVMGDDLPDLPLMRHCGFPVAVADAAQEVLAAAAHVTKLPGGAGCVREVIELILKQSGLWAKVLARYLPPGEDGPERSQ